LKFTNTKKQGDYGLGQAIAHFCSLGITVCVPLTDSQDYDLVVEIDGLLKRVQVKTTSQKTSRGHFAVGLRILGGNSKKNYVHKMGNDVEYDLLFVVTSEGDKYLLPKPINNNSIALNEQYDQYKI
jgi:hypothetical protein